MQRIPTYRQSLQQALQSTPRITLHDADMIQAHRIDQIRAKASVHATRNPAPRALFLLG